MLTRALKLAAAGLLLAVVASACGGGAKAGSQAKLCRTDDPRNRQTILLPPVLGGLGVFEDAAGTRKLREANKKNATYTCDGTVFALRHGKALKAVLMVQRLTPDARPDDPDFRTKVVQGIAGTSRKPDPMSGTLVYRAKQNDQLFAIWFRERFLEILMVREDQTFSGDVDFNRLLIESLSLLPVSV